MQILLNDQPREVAPGASLGDFLAGLGLAPRGVAVAVNGAVAPRSTWATRPLAEGDRVLVIQATQGG